MVFDRECFTYHPVLMRWLYEESKYSEVVQEYIDSVKRAKDDNEKLMFAATSSLILLMKDHNFSVDETDAFYNIESAYRAFRAEETTSLYDLSYQISEIDSADEEPVVYPQHLQILGHSTFYVHFGKKDFEWSGFYFEKLAGHHLGDGDDYYAIVLTAPINSKLLNEAAPIDAVRPFLKAFPLGMDPNIDVNKILEREKIDAKSLGIVEYRSIARGIKLAQKCIRYISTHNNAFSWRYPLSAPREMVRRHRALQLLSLDDEYFEEDRLFDRGWEEILTADIPGEMDFGSLPTIEAESLVFADNFERRRILKQFAAKLFARIGDSAIEGDLSWTNLQLSSSLFDLFSIGQTIPLDHNLLDIVHSDLTEIAHKTLTALCALEFYGGGDPSGIKLAIAEPSPNYKVMNKNGDVLLPKAISKEIIDEFLAFGLLVKGDNFLALDENALHYYQYWESNAFPIADN